MLVVEPDRRYTIKQIIKHRWLSDWQSELQQEERLDANTLPFGAAGGQLQTSSLGSSTTSLSGADSSEVSAPQLDAVVMTHMLQLPGLTADMIAQSVHEQRFDNIYAIYNLLQDKLLQKRRENQRLQHHANLAYSRSRKTSITTGVVDRSEPVKQESLDRLSPLSNANASSSALGFGWCSDVGVDLEKYGDFELECLARPNEVSFCLPDSPISCFLSLLSRPAATCQSAAFERRSGWHLGRQYASPHSWSRRCRPRAGPGQSACAAH